jgi:uncharacterized protein (TIGR02246 family)
VIEVRTRVVTAICSLLAALLLAACAGETTPTVDVEADKAAVRQVLNQWPQDFDAKDGPAVCSLFAPDAVVIFPGTADRDYQTTCNQLQAVLTDPELTYSYAAPDIQEVLVDGDLAAVRLIWTLTVTDTEGAVVETTRENGVDVFQRQSDGTWKIHISHAFPL